MGVESLLMSKISHFTYCVTVEGLNILSALAGREPVYNIAADVRRFPAGMLVLSWCCTHQILLVAQK